MKCDCTPCTVCAGEAAVVCRRKRKRMNLCTRCTLSGDQRLTRLYQEKDIPRLVALDQSVIVPPECAVFDSLLNAVGGIEMLLRLHLDLPYQKPKKG